MSRPSSSPPQKRGSTSRLVLLIVGPFLTFYALCWLIATVDISIRVEVALPAPDFPATARATLDFEHGADQSAEREPPLDNPLVFEFTGGIASLRHFFERVPEPSVTIDVGNCKPAELPIECGSWSVKSPNYVFGAWSAAFSRECSARGKLSCPVP